MKQPRILYCNCTYAQVVPPEVKEAVLRKLCESGVAFDAVADLCELSGRQDPSLKRLADGGSGPAAQRPRQRRPGENSRFFPASFELALPSRQSRPATRCRRGAQPAHAE